MDLDEWNRATAERPPADPCPRCHAGPDAQYLFNADGRRPAWRCSRCHTLGKEVGLPFDLRTPPEGRNDGHLAVETLALLAPTVFDRIDREACYLILRAYFTAGWCIRDVLHAIDYLPDGSPHRGGGNAWERGEPADRTLFRLRKRLMEWRWSEGDLTDGDIMTGPYTATRQAMEARAVEQRERDAVRRAEWDRQDALAQTAYDRSAHVAAFRTARVAAQQGRRARAEAEERGRQQLAADLAERQAAAEAWQALINPDAGAADPR